MGALAGATVQRDGTLPPVSRTRRLDRGEVAPDFQRAVKLVTGQHIDLRGPATPVGGWLSLGIPVGTAGWGYGAVAGTLFFGVSRNERARTEWRDAARVYEDIGQDVFSGQFGLMDVQRLRDAEQVTSLRVDRLNAVLDQIKIMTHRVENGNLAGTAASILAAKLRGLAQHVRVHRHILTEPAPAVPSVLYDAAEALAECGRQLSSVWWESSPVLLKAPDHEIDAVRNNINRYLRMNGLGGTSDIVPTMGPPAAARDETFQVMPSDPVAIEKTRQVLAYYDSTVAGELPAGMGSIVGDLAEQRTWDAVNVAITKRITMELDKLDRLARSQVQELRTAYEATADRLTERERRPLDRIFASTPHDMG